MLLSIRPRLNSSPCATGIPNPYANNRGPAQGIPTYPIRVEVKCRHDPFRDKDYRNSDQDQQRCAGNAHREDRAQRSAAAQPKHLTDGEESPDKHPTRNERTQGTRNRIHSGNEGAYGHGLDVRDAPKERDENRDQDTQHSGSLRERNGACHLPELRRFSIPVPEARANEPESSGPDRPGNHVRNRYNHRDVYGLKHLAFETPVPLDPPCQGIDGPRSHGGAGPQRRENYHPLRPAGCCRRVPQPRDTASRPAAERGVSGLSSRRP